MALDVNRHAARWWDVTGIGAEYLRGWDVIWSTPPAIHIRQYHLFGPSPANLNVKEPARCSGGNIGVRSDIDQESNRPIGCRCGDLGARFGVCDCPGITVTSPAGAGGVEGRAP